MIHGQGNLTLTPNDIAHLSKMLDRLKTIGVEVLSIRVSDHLITLKWEGPNEPIVTSIVKQPPLPLSGTVMRGGPAFHADLAREGSAVTIGSDGRVQPYSEEKIPFDPPVRVNPPRPSEDLLLPRTPAPVNDEVGQPLPKARDWRREEEPTRARPIRDNPQA